MKRSSIVAVTMCLVLTHALATADVIVLEHAAAPRAAEYAVAEADVNWADSDHSDDDRCTVAFAACEAQHYLRAITGRSNDWTIVGADAKTGGNALVISALRGPGSDLELGPEGYRLETTRAGGQWRITVTAEERIGALYGVYDVLHRLGVRWYSPGQHGKEVPRSDLRAVPAIDATGKPAFELRGFHAWENRGNTDFLLWMARNRLNYWCVQQEGKPLLHKLGIHLIGGGHCLTAWYLGPAGRYPYNHTRADGDDDLPDDPYPVSPAFAGDGNNDGRLSTFEAHPEWYALRGGKRSARIKGDFGDNFCTSNPHAMAEWVRNAVQDLVDGRNRDATLMNAWMLDVGKWCECAACKAQGTRTDRNLCVIHAYARGIATARAEGRINRRIRLLFLAYADVLEPPSKPLPPGFDYGTCIATYFPIRRCYVHRFDDPDCPQNARYLAHLEGWAVDPDRHYKGQLCIGEYYNVSRYKCLPACFMRTMVSDIPYYHKLGARYFHYMHCTTRNWGNKALTNWQMARQVWLPDVDCGVLWDDYFAGRYGPAAADMRRFYGDLERMLCNVTELKYNLAPRLDRGDKVLYPGGHLVYSRPDGTPADVPGLQDMLGSARACRATIDTVLQSNLPARVRHRVAEDERLFAYGERTLQYFDLASQAFAAAREGRIEEGRAKLRELKRVAEQLRADTESTAHSSSHASAPNAFVATYATKAVGRIEKLLEEGAACGKASP